MTELSFLINYFPSIAFQIFILSNCLKYDNIIKFLHKIDAIKNRLKRNNLFWWMSSIKSDIAYQKWCLIVRLDIFEIYLFTQFWQIHRQSLVKHCWSSYVKMKGPNKQTETETELFFKLFYKLQTSYFWRQKFNFLFGFLIFWAKLLPWQILASSNTVCFCLVIFHWKQKLEKYIVRVRLKTPLKNFK